MKLYEYLNKNRILPPPGTLIIDLGCGDGRVLGPFYREGYAVLGVDMDAGRVSVAQGHMTEGVFGVQDLRLFTVPKGGFMILRNVLPFFRSKEEVRGFLNKHPDHTIYFTLFGKNDEMADKALIWSREEVDSICSNVGAIIIEVQDGPGHSLSGDSRRCHIFHCLKM